MFEYNIYGAFDENIFNKQCAALERHIPNLRKNNFLEDVDGSQIQIYNFSDGNEIKVINDNFFGVYVESDVSLEKYFN